MNCCESIVIKQKCPVCGAPMTKVYDEYYSCSADHLKAMEWLKVHPGEKLLEPVHSFACLDLDEDILHFEGSFFFTLNQLWHLMDDEDPWPPKRVGHVVI